MAPQMALSFPHPGRVRGEPAPQGRRSRPVWRGPWRRRALGEQPPALLRRVKPVGRRFSRREALWAVRGSRPEKTELSAEALPRAVLAGTLAPCGPRHAERREGVRMGSGLLARPAPTVPAGAGAPTAAAQRKPAPRASLRVLGPGGRSMGGPRVASLLDVSRRGQGSRAHCRAALEAWEGGWGLAGQWYLLLP